MSIILVCEIEIDLELAKVLNLLSTLPSDFH